MSYDAWRTTPPDYGNSANADPVRAFWQGFRFAQRHGNGLSYLDTYRGTKLFGPLVLQAEGLLQHHAGCDCQVCLRVGAA